MNKQAIRVGVAVMTVLGGILTMGASAFAVDPTPDSVVTDQIAALKTPLLAVAAAALGAAVIFLAIRRGWGWVRSFVK